MATTSPVTQPRDLVELFGPQACDKSLPANEVVEQYSFGQFIRLRYRPGGGEPPRAITARRHDRELESALPLLGAGPLVQAVSMLAVFSGNPALPDGSSADPGGIKHIRIRDINELLARNRIELDGGEADLALEEDDVRDLLAGASVETIATKGRTRHRIMLEPASELGHVANEPAVRHYVVPSLARFLADPVVPGVGGSPYPVKLTGAAVEELRKGGGATFGTNGDEVTVVVDGDCAPAPESASFAARATEVGPGTEMVRDEFRDAVRRQRGAHLLPAQSPDLYTVGLYLPWTQVWRLKGYSRGALAHSLTLAPQEATTIELFTWDRRSRSLDQSSLFETDQSLEQTDTTKDVLEVVRELANSSDFKIEGHANVHIKYAMVEADIGAGGDYTSKLNATARVTTNHLAESTERAAARVRVTRQTRISETSEIGSEERVTRKVQNPNMCRTLTLDYFEVLAHYDVTTAFAKDDAQVCFFVEFPPSLHDKEFSEVDLRTHEQALRNALLDHTLADGFEAARSTYARAWAMAHVCDAPECAKKKPPVVTGGTSTNGEQPTPPAALEDAVKNVIKATRALVTASLDSIVMNVVVAEAAATPADLLAVQRHLYWRLLQRRDGSLAAGLLEVAETDVVDDGKIKNLAALVAATPTMNLMVLDTGGSRDDAGPILGPELKQTMLKFGYNPDAFQVGGPSKGQSLFAALVSAIWNQNGADPDDAGLVAALNEFHKEERSYSAAGDSGPPLPGGGSIGKTQEDAKSETEADQVRNSFPLSESAAAAERVDALVRHLNDFKSHYRYALLQAMPIGDQMHELALAGIPTELIEPRVLGMVNGGLGEPDLLAVPINTALQPEWKVVRETFFDDNSELTSLRFDSVVRMPTPGVSVEARLGRCDACGDFILSSRNVDLDQRRAEARAEAAAAHQAELEAERLRARLNAGTLDPATPAPPSLHVTVEEG